MKPRRPWPLPVDLTGHQYGQWLVLGPGAKHKFWQCRCTCGTVRDVCGGNLRGGLSRSCGCVKDRKTSERMRTHGETKTRLYTAWGNMRGRCSNPNLVEYPRYGGRGITVCTEWNVFTVFRDWALANGYRPDLTLDRIDSDKGYGPENCRWATRATQALNRDCVKTDNAGRHSRNHSCPSKRHRSPHLHQPPKIRLAARRCRHSAGSFTSEARLDIPVSTGHRSRRRKGPPPSRSHSSPQSPRALGSR